MYLQALFEIGLVLFGITIFANLLAQLLLRTMTRKMTTRVVQ
jgi:ABC-type phosphate transport system permease subunit